MGLRKKIKKKICEYLLYKNIFTSKKVPNSKVSQFLSLIKPKILTIDNIRLGGSNDGGYIIPNDFNGINFCFSPGVGNISKFEEDLSKKKTPPPLADYSVDNNFNDNSYINFEKKFLGPISYKNYISLKDWILSKINYENENDLILQMDIEGDEYEVLQSIDLKTLKKFRIILIEFHNFHYLFDEFYFEKMSKIFKILLEHYFCSHIHPNNDVDFISKSHDIEIPPVLEFSFLRRDRAKEVGDINNFPNILDQPNNPKKRDIILPDCFFK